MSYLETLLDNLIIPQVFNWLFKESKINQQEALKTFNCGTGMVLVVNNNKVNDVQSILKHYKCNSLFRVYCVF